MTRPQAAWTPPPRDGVSASRVAVVAGPWATVAAFLAQRLRPGIDWPARLAAGEVLDAKGRALPPDAPCVPGSVLWYWRALPPEPRVPFELDVLHRDEHLVVVDKPHFLSAIPGGRYLQETALVRLRRLLHCADLVPLHRLDRETAGVLMFSARPDTRDAYHALLRDRRVHKVYEAVAPWRAGLALPLTARHRLQDPPEARHMPAQVVPGEPNAMTLIEMISRLDEAVTARALDGPDPGPLAHYRLTPITGRRHQLRAQLSALGLPIVGDRIYPRLWPHPPEGAEPDYRQPLQLLAREVGFTDPVSGLPRRFASRRRLQLADAGSVAAGALPVPDAGAGNGDTPPGMDR